MKHLLLCALLLLPEAVWGQNSTEDSAVGWKRNSIYLQVGTEPVLQSVCIDRLWRSYGLIKTSVSAGLNVYIEAGKGSYDHYFGIPVSYNMLVGKKHFHAEAGLGVTLMFNMYQYDYYYDTINISTGRYDYFKAGNEELMLLITPRIGGRYQRRNGGAFVGLYYMPVINLCTFTSRVVAPDGNLHYPAEFTYISEPSGLYSMHTFSIMLGYTF